MCKTVRSMHNLCLCEKSTSASCHGWVITTGRECPKCNCNQFKFHYSQLDCSIRPKWNYYKIRTRQNCVATLCVSISQLIQTFILINVQGKTIMSVVFKFTKPFFVWTVKNENQAFKQNTSLSFTGAFQQSDGALSTFWTLLISGSKFAQNAHNIAGYSFNVLCSEHLCKMSVAAKDYNIIYWLSSDVSLIITKS